MEFGKLTVFEDKSCEVMDCRGVGVFLDILGGTRAICDNLGGCWAIQKL